MQFRLLYSTEARDALKNLEQTDLKKYRKVLKILALMETNLRHPSLQTHKFDKLSVSNEQEVFEAYVENKTLSAFRVFWYYGLGQGIITVLSITSHP